MKAWELLSEEGKWTQGRCARDKNGEGCPSSSKAACSFCTLGAIARCYPDGDDWFTTISKLEFTLKERGFSPLIAEWNDEPDRTKEEVVALLKELDV